MIVDANILVYAVHASFGERHRRCHAWLEDRMSTDRVGLPWVSLLAFVRLSTSPRVFERPMTSRGASDLVGEWLRLPNVWVPAPAADHVDTFARMVTLVGAAGNDVYDAHLAALALDHGVAVASADAGFDRFPVRVLNPASTR
jgi:toxin-antitoxin system PIN domain toxin